MNCPACQAPNEPDSAFCGNCGTRLAPAPAPAGGREPPSWQSPSAGYGTPTGQYSPARQYPPEQSPAAGQYPSAQYPSAGQTPPEGQYQSTGQQPPAGYPQAGGQYQPQGPGQYQPRPAGAAVPFQFELKRLPRVDQVVAGASLIAMISIWLPWYSISGNGQSASFSGTWGHGWLWLEFVVALALIGYLLLRAGWETPLRLPIAHAPLLLIGTGLQLLLILIAFAVIPYGNLGMGWDWAAFIGLIAALAAAGPLMVPAARSYLDNRR